MLCKWLFLKQYCAKHGMNDQWQQHIKMGSVLVLLLWAISECFNNETTGREIWRVIVFLLEFTPTHPLPTLRFWYNNATVTLSHLLIYLLPL